MQPGLGARDRAQPQPCGRAGRVLPLGRAACGAGRRVIAGGAVRGHGEEQVKVVLARALLRVPARHLLEQAAALGLDPLPAPRVLDDGALPARARERRAHGRGRPRGHAGQRSRTRPCCPGQQVQEQCGGRRGSSSPRPHLHADTNAIRFVEEHDGRPEF